MTTGELLTDLRRQGFSLRPLPGGKLEIRPASKLTDDLRQAIRQHKDEILVRLRSGGVTAEEVAEVFPGAMAIEPELQTPAVTWLKEKLTPGPRRIAPLIAEWVGTLNNPTGWNMDDLMQARWALGVVPYVGADGRFWWRLPQERVQ